MSDLLMSDFFYARSLFYFSALALRKLVLLNGCMHLMRSMHTVDSGE